MFINIKEINVKKRLKYATVDKKYIKLKNVSTLNQKMMINITKIKLNIVKAFVNVTKQFISYIVNSVKMLVKVDKHIQA